MIKKKRTQLDRRAETQRLLMASATRLFGERGYDDTSLEDIAGDCGLTTGPIYHYYGSKKELFRLVHEALLEHSFMLLRGVSGGDLRTHMLLQTKEILNIYKEPHLFRILMVDGPIVLGDARWTNQQFIKQLSISLLGTQLIDERSMIGLRLLFATTREAIMTMANAESQAKTRRYLVEALTPLVMTVADHLEQFAAKKSRTRKKVAPEK